MNNNYKIIRTIFENTFQRVLECKDNDTGDIFYSNIITSRKVINLINLEELRSISSNILECYNTDDRMYIYTKPLKPDYKALREQLTNELTFKQQFILSENVIKLAQGIFNMTDAVQQKILDIDKLYVDSDNQIYVDCDLVFEQEYDIADNETFKRLGNLIHLIFTGNEIIDYNISDDIAPDILKIIVRCLTKEYMFPNDVLEEMKESPIYSMIFDVGSYKEKPLPENISVKVEKKQTEYKKSESVKSVSKEVAKEPHSEEEAQVLDIFVNDSNTSKKKLKVTNHSWTKEIIRAAVSILIVVVVLLVGNKLINKFSEGREVISPENSLSSGINSGGELETPQDGQGELSDSTEKYFNEKLLNDIGYTGSKAEVDSAIYVEGKNSLLVANEGEDKVKALFAAVDFTDEKFNYMLKKQISISAKMKAESETDVQVVLEAYKGGSLTSNFHTIVKVSNDIWSQFTVPINVTDADTLNIYIEYEGENKVWVDAVYIDVIK